MEGEDKGQRAERRDVVQRTASRLATPARSARAGPSSGYRRAVGSGIIAPLSNDRRGGSGTMTGSGDGPVTQGEWGRTRLPQTVAAPASGSAPGTAWTSPPTPEQVHAVATGVVAQVPGPGAPQPTITARVEPVAPPAPPVRLVYDGKLGELYVIYLRSLILTLLSFGFYRFWGRTRVRRYLWSHFSAFGDRFEYRGLGVELFLGFLSVVGVLLVFQGLIVGGVYLAGPDSLPDGFGVTDAMSVAVVLLAWPLLPVGQFAGWRYKFTRTAWRGIRSGLGGSAWTYGFTALGLGFINAMCMRLLTPVVEVNLTGYRTRHTTFGTVPFGFAGRASDIYGRYIGFLALNLLAWFVLMVVVAVVVGVGADWFQKQFGPASDILEKLAHPTPLVVLILFGAVFALYTLIGIVILPVRCWWQAYSLRYMVSRAWFGPVQFATGVTTRQMWGFIALNWIILIFTLGIGGPWVMHRTAKLIASQVWIYGEIDALAVAQALGGGPSVGEGLLDMFDAGGV